MSTRTAAPWVYKPEYKEVWGEDFTVAYVRGPHADGHLIAAAPDLYEALHELKELSGYEWPVTEAVDKARDALAKARGE